MSFVKERFHLNQKAKDTLHDMEPPFGYNGFGEFIYYSRYSRTRLDGGQESWADTVIRYIEGTFSIRKDWYIRAHITWHEDFWQSYATKMAISGFRLQWSPPGRGLWAMGTDFVYERGAMALYNCAATMIGDDPGSDIAWGMDALMHGVGVGYYPIRDSRLTFYNPKGKQDHVIPDTREGWAESAELLINAYVKPGMKKPRFIYDKIRPANLPIKGFGGVSSGPEPLKWFHQKVEEYCERYQENEEYDSVRWKADCANATGCCVVAGNVRRSAEILLGKPDDLTFMDLKNYRLHPDRQDVGWMSNNSVILESDEDFSMLGEVAKRILMNGEPGAINLRNFPYGRLGKWDQLRKDRAKLINPCGEIQLEHREVCNVDETLPTMCSSADEWHQACEYATVYASTVSLLPTHQPSTNKVVAKNRRIGVSIIDFTGWKQQVGIHEITRQLRAGYKIVRKTNRWCNEEAGVPIAIRVTTVKPGGTIPKMPGKTSGMGYPNFHYTLRRVRLSMSSPICDLLDKAGVPKEKDAYSMNTWCYEWPILQGPAKQAYEATVWEQAMNLILMQREWADNSVSNTLNFRPMWPLVQLIEGSGNVSTDAEALASYIGYPTASRLLRAKEKEYIVPERYKIVFHYKEHGAPKDEIEIREFDPKHEEGDIEAVLSAIMPLVKSVSLLPHSAKGAYKQMPEEGITKTEYEERLSHMRPIDWSSLSGSDGQDELYCSGDKCEIHPGR